MIIIDYLLKELTKDDIIPLNIPKNLINDFIGMTEFTKKVEISIKIIQELNKRYFDNFENCFAFYKDLQNFEGDFLYKLYFYRDHFLHSFQVFILGCYLIKIAKVSDLPFDFLSPTNIESFLRIWFLISIYHDIGYTTQKLAQIGNEVNEKYFQNISGVRLSKFSLSFNTYLKGVFKKILDKLSFIILGGEENLYSEKAKGIDKIQKAVILNEMIDNFENNNHGVISSLFLHYSFNLDVELIDISLKEVYLKELAIACAGISTHDLEKYKKIHLNFKKNPFGCLLILCDNLQDWYRPSTFKDQEEILISFNFNIDQKEKLYIIKLGASDNIDLKVCNKFFDTFERIFSYSIINGPNFLFKISSPNQNFELKIYIKPGNTKYSIERNDKK